jgi:hypothetical protein
MMTTFNLLSILFGTTVFLGSIIIFQIVTKFKNSKEMISAITKSKTDLTDYVQKRSDELVPILEALYDKDAETKMIHIRDELTEFYSQLVTLIIDYQPRSIELLPKLLNSLNIVYVNTLKEAIQKYSASKELMDKIHALPLELLAQIKIDLRRLYKVQKKEVPDFSTYTPVQLIEILLQHIEDDSDNIRLDLSQDEMTVTSTIQKELSPELVQKLKESVFMLSKNDNLEVSTLDSSSPGELIEKVLVQVKQLGEEANQVLPETEDVVQQYMDLIDQLRQEKKDFKEESKEYKGIIEKIYNAYHEQLGLEKDKLVTKLKAKDMLTLFKLD